MFTPETRFLIVDDLRTMRMTLRKILRKMGHAEVDEAQNGQQAYEMLENAASSEKPYQCVISDWNLTGMSGLDLLVKVRGVEDFKTIPFVLVTSANEQKQVLEAAKAGVSQYIVKPIIPSDFEKKLMLVQQRHFKNKAS